MALSCTCSHKPSRSLSAKPLHLIINAELALAWLARNAAFLVGGSQWPPDLKGTGVQSTADLKGIYNVDIPHDSTASSSTCPPGLTRPQAAFPTDSAEKKRNAKRRAKELGIEWVTNKQTKHVEPHFDDCGEDLRAIADESHYVVSDSDSSTDVDQLEESLLTFSLLGPDHDGLDAVPSSVLFADRPSDILSCSSDGTRQSLSLGCEQDILEMVRGSFGLDRITLRDRSSSSRQDFIVCCDLTDSSVCTSIKSYLQQCGPTLLVMSSKESPPLFADCISIQQQRGHHFLYELTNAQLTEDSVRNVAQSFCTSYVHTPSGAPSVLFASDDLLLQSIRRFGDNHPWSYSYACSVLKGIACLDRKRELIKAYPSIGVGPEDGDQPDDFSKCRGCRQHANRSCSTHTRVPGECRFPLDEPTA